MSNLSSEMETMLVTTQIDVSSEDLASALSRCNRKNSSKQNTTDASKAEYLEVLRILHKGSSKERLEALEKIESSLNSEDLVFIVPLLDDPDDSIKIKALETFRKYRAKEYHEIVSTFAESSNKKIVAAADYALSEMLFEPATLKCIYRSGKLLDICCNVMVNEAGETFDLHVTMRLNENPSRLPEDFSLTLRGKTVYGILFPRIAQQNIRNHFVFRELSAGNYQLLPSWSTAKIKISPDASSEIFKRKTLLAAASSLDRRKTFALYTDNPNLLCTMDIDPSNRITLYFSVLNKLQTDGMIEFWLFDKSKPSYKKDDLPFHTYASGQVKLSHYEDELTGFASLGELAIDSVSRLEVHALFIPAVNSQGQGAENE